MCAEHWAMLPEKRKKAIYREYRPGQCQLNPLPSPQWHDAADCAIFYVHMILLKKEIDRLRDKKRFRHG